jgi:oligopeptidase B
LLNRRPEALGGVLLEAPFVDVLSAMCQPELPLTVHEHEEWGDPGDGQLFEQVRGALCCCCPAFLV